MNYGEALFSLTVDLQSYFRKNIKINGASYPQILALAVIPDDGIEMSSLSKCLGLDTSTVTRLVIGLEKKGWVKRKKSSKDNRVIMVFISELGEEIKTQLEKRIDTLGLSVEKEIEYFQRSDLLELLWSTHWAISKLLLKK